MGKGQRVDHYFLTHGMNQVVPTLRFRNFDSMRTKILKRLLWLGVFWVYRHWGCVSGILGETERHFTHFLKCQFTFRDPHDFVNTVHSFSRATNTVSRDLLDYVTGVDDLPRTLGEYVTSDGLIVCEHHHLWCQVPGGDHDVSEAKLQPAIPASCPEVLMTPTNSVSMHAAWW